MDDHRCRSPVSVWILTDDAVNAALGAEVRRAREAAGLTRPELVAQLPFKIAVATVLNWELGHRSISHSRLIEVARTLRTSAPALLRRAIDRVEVIESLLVELDLRPLCDDANPRFGILRTWAENKLTTLDNDGSVVRLHHSVIRELAVLLSVRLADLVSHLTHTTSFRQVSAQHPVANHIDDDLRRNHRGAAAHSPSTNTD
jgi:transcriptional regulator with XRE-family HTH domain